MRKKVQRDQLNQTWLLLQRVENRHQTLQAAERHLSQQLNLMLSMKLEVSQFSRFQFSISHIISCSLLFSFPGISTNSTIFIPDNQIDFPFVPFIKCKQIVNIVFKQNYSSKNTAKRAKSKAEIRTT
jgi:hypothetical protein